MENPFLAATSGERLHMPDMLEVSAGFHPDTLPVFLWKIVPMIQEDFGAEHVRQLIQLADWLKLNEARRINYRATHRGRRIDFRIILFRYQPEAIGFYLKGPWALAHQVEKELEGFFSGESAGE